MPACEHVPCSQSSKVDQSHWTTSVVNAVQVVTVMRAEVAPAPALDLHGRQEAEQEEPASTPHDATQPGFLDRTLTGAKSIMPR